MEKFQIYFFAVVFLAVLFLSYLIFLPFFIPLSVAAVLAFLFHPFYERLSRLTGGWPGISAFITVILAVFIIILPLAFVGTAVFREAMSVSAQINNGGAEAIFGILKSAEAKLSLYFPGYSFDFSEYLRSGVTWFTQNIGSVFAGIARVTISLFLNIFIGIIAFYYFLKDGKKIVRTIVLLSPLPDKNDYEILSKLEGTISSVVRGSLSVAVIQGLLTWIGFTIFGVPNPALFGSITTIAALVPGAGTSLVLVPAIIYLFATGSTSNAIGLAVWAATAIGLVDNILGPFLMRRGIKIHPLLILLSVIGGMGFFGPVGFLIGPMVLSLLFAMIDIYRFLIGSRRKS